jgi:transposase
MLTSMPPPLFIRTLTDAERQQLEAALRSQSAFTLRRAQIVRASAQGQRPSQIAKNLACSVQSVRNALHAFQNNGREALTPQSSRPKTVQPVLDDLKREQVQALLHQSPRTLGKARSTWTLSLLSEVCCEQGLSERPLSLPTIRDAIVRLGANWKRAKHWITSPDPAYVRKKTDATG